MFCNVRAKIVYLMDTLNGRVMCLLLLLHAFALAIQEVEIQKTETLKVVMISFQTGGITITR